MQRCTDRFQGSTQCIDIEWDHRNLIFFPMQCVAVFTDPHSPISNCIDSGRLAFTWNFQTSGISWFLPILVSNCLNSGQFSLEKLDACDPNVPSECTVATSDADPMLSECTVQRIHQVGGRYLSISTKKTFFCTTDFMWFVLTAQKELEALLWICFTPAYDFLMF